MKKVLLYGIGSFQNRGVEAIIKSTIDQMDESYEIKAATLYNSYNSKKYSNKIKEYVPHISSNSKISDTYTNDRNKLKRIQKELLEENMNEEEFALISDNSDKQIEFKFKILEFFNDVGLITAKK